MDEVADHAQRHRRRPLAVCLALLVIVVAADLAGRALGDEFTAVVVTGLINLILVVGLYVFVGHTRASSRSATSAFAAIGAYTAGILVDPVRDEGASVQLDAGVPRRRSTRAPLVADADRWPRGGHAPAVLTRFRSCV